MFDAILQAAWEGFLLVFSWPNILYPVIGTLLVMYFALLPGLSGATLMALAIPVTFFNGTHPSNAYLWSFCQHSGFPEGKICNPDPSGIPGKKAKLDGIPFLGTKVLCVSTIGLDEEVIRAYIRNQEEEQKRQEQLDLGGFSPLRSGGGPFEGPSSNHPLCGW